MYLLASDLSYHKYKHNITITNKTSMNIGDIKMTQNDLIQSIEFGKLKPIRLCTSGKIRLKAESLQSFVERDFCASITWLGSNSLLKKYRIVGISVKIRPIDCMILPSIDINLDPFEKLECSDKTSLPQKPVKNFNLFI